MDTRLEQQEAFVKKNGWEEADLFPLKADASNRTYTRLIDGSRKCLLMDAPPETENLKAYLDTNRYLASVGLRVPEIYAEDLELGMALIEDFGADTFTKLLADGLPEAELYDLATDVLIHTKQQGKPEGIQLQPYDMAALMREVNLFTEWFVPHVRGESITEAERDVWNSVWQKALANIARDQAVFVYRDFHVDNAMRLEGEGVTACGLLDFQDALLGSPVYDLVSLIEDARREVSAETRRAVLAKYFAAFPELDRIQFLNDIATLGAQRHAKVSGIFIRLSERDDKHVYLKHIPHVLRLLDRSLSQPHLGEIRDLVHKMVPGFLEREFPEPQTSLVPAFHDE
ncbi:aminoglycoside phosphotransferase family protein [Kordiimonas laminariae]|uniref:aminoglycoside phosphotransferase family protein n=1 Tax=Kordiimonas laminariae TaxID=2917717 RepID=UPI001FF6482D|nr:phosphotransferase [Kordiimonas laminariae]